MAQSPSFLGINSLNFMRGLPFPKPRPLSWFPVIQPVPIEIHVFRKGTSDWPTWSRKNANTLLESISPFDQSNNQNNHNKNNHNNHVLKNIYNHMEMIALLTNISPNLKPHHAHLTSKPILSAPKIRFFPAGRRHRRPKNRSVGSGGWARQFHGSVIKHLEWDV